MNVVNVGILRISPYSVRMRENTHQNNSEYGHFWRSDASLHFLFWALQEFWLKASFKQLLLTRYVRLISYYLFLHIFVFCIKRIFIGILYKVDPNPGPGLLEKVHSRPLEKADHVPKSTVWVKNSILTNLRVLISNMTIVFLNIPAEKYPNEVFLVLALGILIPARNFAIGKIWERSFQIWQC